MVNHRLWRIEEMLTEYPRSSSARSYPQGLENFVRINRSEIVNLDAVDGFEGRSALPLGLSKNCYYIGKIMPMSGEQNKAPFHHPFSLASPSLHLYSTYTQK